jgi:hypothetical protein
MSQQGRHDWDRTIIRLGGRDTSITQLVKVALAVLLALLCVAIAVVTGFELAYVGALIAGAYGLGTLLT